jgi:hypothetical protein
MLTVVMLTCWIATIASYADESPLVLADIPTSSDFSRRDAVVSVHDATTSTTTTLPMVH